MSWPVPERRERLLALYLCGLSYREIAKRYGGTPDGVRGTLRKMLERENPLAMPQTKAVRMSGHVRRLRELGLRQCEISERLGVDRNTVARAMKA